MIKTFKDKATFSIFCGKYVKKGSKSEQVNARKKIIMIDVAQDLNDLLIPAGNKLEQLSGNRAEQHSIRVNRKWRICFKWENGDALDVEFTDYH